MRRYRLSQEAKRDLDQIFEYVSRHGGWTAAERLIDTITDRFPLLGAHPEAGRQREEIDPGTRSFPVGNYLIYYRNVPSGIEIARVLHGSRDQRRAFWREM